MMSDERRFEPILSGREKEKRSTFGKTKNNEHKKENTSDVHWPGTASVGSGVQSSGSLPSSSLSCISRVTGSPRDSSEAKSEQPSASPVSPATICLTVSSRVLKHAAGTSTQLVWKRQAHRSICPLITWPEVFADWLAGDLEDDHGRVQFSEGLDGRDVNREDVGCVNSWWCSNNGIIRNSQLLQLNADKPQQNKKLTWVQQTALKCRFERREQLLPLVGSFQAKLQVFNGSFGFWEIWVTISPRQVLKLWVLKRLDYIKYDKDWKFVEIILKCSES